MNAFAMITACLALAVAAFAQDPAVEPERSGFDEASSRVREAAAAQSAQIVVPIRQITRLQGAMPETLTGIGLVTGLNGTGSSDKASRQLLTNWIRSLERTNIADTELTTGAWALVAVNATLPAFAKEGMQLTAYVTTLSDASSLQGGRLQLTYLRAQDDQIYATAAGPVSIAGFGVSAGPGGGTRVARNNPVSGRVAGGVQVVRPLHSTFLSEAGHLELGLIHPSLANAQAIATAINEAQNASGFRAGVVDENLVRIELPFDRRDESTAIRLLTAVGPLRIRTENPATVVIDENTGIIIAGEGVTISPCVFALEDITISVVSEDEVVQPLPGVNINNAETAIVNRTRIDVQSRATTPKPLSGGATVAELLANLKALELSPRQLIQVFDYLSENGYLQARLVKR